MFYLYEDQIIELIRNIVKKYQKKLQLVLIYGSFSRHQHMPNSDLDVLIVGDEKVRHEILDAFSEVYVKYSVMVSVLYYSYRQYHLMKNHPFIKRALKEGIIIWERKKI